MLTEANYKDYVGFQESKATPALAFMLSVGSTKSSTFEDDDVATLTNDQLADKMMDENPFKQVSMSIEKQVMNCTLTLDEMLEQVNKHLLSFPVTTRGEHFANLEIARKTRRGMGNKRIDDVVLYKSASNQFDACMIVVKFEDLYGIALQNNFLSYGFVLDDGPKV